VFFVRGQPSSFDQSSNMSQAAFAFLCVGLLASVAYGDYFSECPTSETSCESDTSIKIEIIGEGSCDASASSYCTALALSTGECIDIGFNHITDECRFASAYEDASCWAKAAAFAYTEAFATVLCDGEMAYGCADADAAAEAIACAIAKAIIDISIKLGKNTAECDAKIVVAMKAMAKAVSESEAKACSANGFLSTDHDVDWAYAFQEVLAEAFAYCWAYCDEDGNSSSGGFGGGSGTIIDEHEFEFGDGSEAEVGGK